MKTIKVVRFPGETREFVVDENATVRDVLKLANINIENEEEVKGDGRIVDLDDGVVDFDMLIVTKRLKGAF